MSRKRNAEDHIDVADGTKEARLQTSHQGELEGGGAPLQLEGGEAPLPLPPPLTRDTLWLVCGYLTKMKEVCAVANTCTTWRQNLLHKHTQSLGLTLTRTASHSYTVASLCQSPLTRHVGQLGRYYNTSSGFYDRRHDEWTITEDSLYLLTRPGVICPPRLICGFKPCGEAFSFPMALRHLNIGLSSSVGTSHMLQFAVDAIGQLTELTHCTLQLDTNRNSLSEITFTPMAMMRALRELTLTVCSRIHDVQWRQLQTLRQSGLRLWVQEDGRSWWDDSTLFMALDNASQLAWTSISHTPIFLGPASSSLIAKWASLREISLLFSNTETFSCLMPHAPNLHALSLAPIAPSNMTIATMVPLLRSLSVCTQLVELTLANMTLTSVALGPFLACLVCLERLTLRSVFGFHSLECLTQLPSPLSLTHLSVVRGNQLTVLDPTTDLLHVHRFTNLVFLCLVNCFADTDATKRMYKAYTKPLPRDPTDQQRALSRVFPRLHTFKIWV